MNGTAMAYRLLEEGQHRQRRSIADALEVLRTHAGFTDGDIATVRVGWLKLPPGNIVGLVQLVFCWPAAGHGFLVALPAATEFGAANATGIKRVCLDIAQLDGGTVASDGSVTLASGINFRAVEIMPARMREPSDLDLKLIVAAIDLCEAKERCYRNLRAQVPADFRETVRDFKLLDCSELTKLKVPQLKVIAALIADQNRSLQCSEQKLADAFSVFGIRQAMSRPRKNGHQVSAAI
jgi:hypothetical protein